MQGVMDGLDGLTAREAQAIIGCLQREIERIERGESNWLLYEEEYRSAVAKLRALVLMSVDAVPVTREYRDALAAESSRLENGILGKQLAIPGFLETECKMEPSAESDHPAEAKQGVKDGSDASGNAESDNHDVDITA